MKDPKKQRLIIRSIILSITVVAAVFILWRTGIICWKFGQFFEKVSEWNSNQDDDQRSTLWPLLVSLIITMVGSLITTYVFLKEALDRTSDEKPFFRTVIQAYREKTMRYLWRYTFAALILIIAVMGLYMLLYFANLRFHAYIRIFIACLYAVGLCISLAILHRCIYIDRGLNKTAEKLLKERVSQNVDAGLQNKLDDLEKIGLFGENRVEWLQIDRDSSKKDYKDYIDAEKFIARFSEWEKLAMLLVEQKANPFDIQSLHKQIKTSLEKGIEIFHAQDSIESEDAKENQWKAGAYEKIQHCEQVLSLSKDIEAFLNAFLFLVECRNLLLVLFDTANNIQKENENEIINNAKSDEFEGKRLSNVFFYFLVGLSIEVFRVIPKIEVFFPSGRFVAANFYNTRIENSAFRSSLFQYAVFARTKINSSNFSISRFDHCEFFSADSRDCSFSNTELENCGFNEAIFDYVDFTGAVFTKCILSNTYLSNTILVNLVLNDITLDNVECVNSKLKGIQLHYEKVCPAFKNCNFSDSSLRDIQICYKEKLGIPNYTNNDLVVRQFFKFLHDEITQDKFYTENALQKFDYQQMHDLVKSFSTCSDLFFQLSKKRGEGKNATPTHSVWDSIKDSAIIPLEECVFNRTVMPEVRFYRTNLDQSVFCDAQMNNSVLFCVYMPGCIMNSANLRGTLMWAVAMQGVMLRDAILFKSFCKLVNFEDAALQSLHASESVLQYCSFSRSDCSCVDFTEARISDSTFRDAILKVAELTGAKFKNVIFDNSVANEMLASYTEFVKCSFLNADLAQSNFNYTTFQDCKFRLASFSNSTVTGVKFENCDFENGNFRGTCFIQAEFENCTNLSTEIFEGCRFVDCRFLKDNKYFKRQLKKQQGIMVL